MPPQPSHQGRSWSSVGTPHVSKGRENVFCVVIWFRSPSYFLVISHFPAQRALRWLWHPPLPGDRCQECRPCPLSRSGPVGAQRSWAACSFVIAGQICYRKHNYNLGLCVTGADPSASCWPTLLCSVCRNEICTPRKNPQVLDVC